MPRWQRMWETNDTMSWFKHFPGESCKNTIAIESRMCQNVKIQSLVVRRWCTLHVPSLYSPHTVYDDVVADWIIGANDDQLSNDTWMTWQMIWNSRCLPHVSDVVANMEVWLLTGWSLIKFNQHWSGVLISIFTLLDPYPKVYGPLKLKFKVSFTI